MSTSISRLYSFILLYSSLTCAVFSQADTTAYISFLPGLQVSAYSSRSHVTRLPATVHILQDSLHTDLSFFSLAKLINQSPGVRLEERSPGSYRISVRGSTLRSPFGVRNIKVYLDGFNLTDGGGNTYLQILSPELISKAEIIKGPASSMYGAGVGGSLLLSSELNKNSVSIGIGNLGQLKESIRYGLNLKKWKISAVQSHEATDGYRQQSAMRRDMIYLSQEYNTDKGKLKLIQLYSDLEYQTPGGLNSDQATKDRKQARPPAGRIPGAVEQMAAIYNKTVMVGASYVYHLSNHWTVDPRLSYWYTDFRNPFITNYEVRYEGNISARPIIQYNREFDNSSIAWTSGWEYSRQHNLTRNFGNKKGLRDTLQADALINASQNNVFSQVQYNFGKWQVLAGVSSNQQLFRYKTLAASDFTRKESGPVIMPRLSISYSINPQQAFFISTARGNSPPTLAEIRPSSGQYNQELLPENGWNYELGYKLFSKHFSANINVYSLQLKNAIVRRNDNAGVEYFVNAGGANMAGLESWIAYHHKKIELYFSTAYQPYTFSDYKQRTDNFDGKDVTGVPKHTYSFNGSWHLMKYLTLSANWYAQSDLPLNDANTFVLPAYNLIGASVLIKPLPKLSIGLNGQFASSDDYNPGPDINAAVNRFYNPGARQLFSAGLRWSW